MATSRCIKCQAIISKDALDFNVANKRSVKYDSFEALDESARRGCDICALVFQHLVFIADRRNYTGPINLGVGRDHLFLDWDGLQSLGLKLCERECSLRSEESTKHPVRRFAPDAVADDLALLVDEKIKPWIKTCQDKHKKCILGSGPRNLPTRVIDVGLPGKNPRLVVPDEDGESSTRYLCLSYCWGKGNTVARTTKENFAARRREIDYQGLPKTIRDAIDVTRALGDRFLWVDAVCIIQPDGGDDADWRDQAPRMWEYYRDSVCTIAASVTSDSSQGFLSERLGQRYQTQNANLDPWTDPKRPEKGPRMLHVHPSEIQEFKFDQRVDRSPLSERGWVFQEYALSTRLLHWVNHELLYECAELCASEQNPAGFDDGALGWRQPHMKHGHLRSAHREVVLGEEWCTLVTHYTGLNLTYESDRLAALTGIATRTRELFQDEYVFGLWQSQLVLGLAWQATHRWPYHTDVECKAPSWSWASSHAVGVKYPTNGDVFEHVEKLQIVRIEGETDHIAYQKNHAECKLVVRGIFEKRTWQARRTVASKNVVNANRNMERVQFHGSGNDIIFDCPDYVPADARRLSDLGSLDTVMLLTEKEVGEDRDVVETDLFLILKEVEGRDGIFKRIGIARIYSPYSYFKGISGYQTEITLI